MMNFSIVKYLPLKVSLASLLSCFTLAATYPTQAALVDFSQSPWTFTGSVNTPGAGSANLSNDFGNFTVFGSPTLENYLGIPISVLDNFGGEATEGSAIKAQQNFNAGDVISFNWDFATNEPATGYQNDYAFFMADGSVPGTNDLSFIKLADVAGNNASNPFTYTFSKTDNYTIAIGIVDIVDYTRDSSIQISNANTQPVPEPLSILSSAGAVVFGGILKRRFSRQKG
jgi:hypothetical protein